MVSEKMELNVSELKCNGMAQWGVRRRVILIGGYTERENGEEEEEEETNDLKQSGNLKQSGKRKRFSSRLAPMEKKATLENIESKANSKCKQEVALKNPENRWSVQRYEMAEKHLLEVMRAKGALYGNPILRPELRLEARKQIGDTGLLDHLLKHVAGKVAPGGAERFRRRHNPEGAMEYWLESAELVDIRREAGIQDPYWNPPPGWKKGDCPSQDLVCAKEMKELGEETNKLEREMEELVSKKQMEEELAKLRREMEEQLSKKQQQECEATMVSSLVTLEKYMEQVMAISKYVSKIEEEIGKVKPNVQEGTRSDSALMESTEFCDEKEKNQVEDNGQEVVGTEGMGDQRKTNTAGKEAERTAAREGKAAKIQRLKSGFRICKPQGTFLWPNMASSQIVVHVEDLLRVPTPPSVSSSTTAASASPQLAYCHRRRHPASPVKPLAERRDVKVTISAGGDTKFSNTTVTTANNLNDFPAHPGEGFCGTPFSSSPSPSTSSCLAKRVETWLALATPASAPNDSNRG